MSLGPNSPEPNPSEATATDGKSATNSTNHKPSKLDAAGQATVCKVLAVGGTLEMAARVVGCTERAIRYAAARDPDFHQRLLAAKEQTAFRSLETLRRAAVDDPAKNWRAAYYHARMVYPERYHRPANTLPVKQVRKLVDHAVGQVVRQTLKVIDTNITDPETHHRIGQNLEKLLTRTATRPSRKPRH